MKKQKKLDWEVLNDFRMNLPKCKVDVVVGILNGGIVPALIASNVYKVPVIWCKCSSYEDRKKKEFVFENVNIERGSVENKRVLIVDDIVDTGETIRNVYNFIRDYSPKKVRLLSLVIKHKVYELCKKLGIGYTLIVPDKYWVVFPWE